MHFASIYVAYSMHRNHIRQPSQRYIRAFVITVSRVLSAACTSMMQRCHLFVMHNSAYIVYGDVTAYIVF